MLVADMTMYSRLSPRQHEFLILDLVRHRVASENNSIARRTWQLSREATEQKIQERLKRADRHAKLALCPHWSSHLLLDIGRRSRFNPERGLGLPPS